MKYCTHCGNPIEDDAKFCVSCGQPIEEPAVESDSDLFDDSHESSSDDFFSDDHSSSVTREENNKEAEKVAKSMERAPVILRIISFLFPIVGLILYCTWNKEYKRKAKDVGIPALVGFILGLVLEVVYYVLIYFNA